MISISRISNDLYTIEHGGRNITFIGSVNNIELLNIYQIYNRTRNILYYNADTKINNVVFSNPILTIDNYFGVLRNTDSYEIDVYSDYYSTNSEDLLNFELELARTTSGNSYMEYYETDGNVTNVDYWSDATKTIKLFTKVISYSGSNPIEIIITNEIKNKTLTTTIAYTDNVISSVTKVVT